MKRLGGALLLLRVLAPALGYAATETSAPPGTQGAAEQTAGKPQENDRLPIHKQAEWQFFLSPYIWIPGINANISALTGTPGRTPV
jgi:hypothetical protein